MSDPTEDGRVSPADQFLTGDPEVDATRMAYLLLITAVAILSVVVSIVYYLIPNEQVRQVLLVMDGVYAIIFLLDFFLRLYVARDRTHYFVRGGWLDLLGSIPGFPFLRLLRIYRIVRGYRVIRSETPQEVAEMAREKLAESVLFITSFIVLLVVTLGSIAIVLVESPAPDANIKTGYEASWWSLVTIATVGYGDYVPVTGWGRIIGALMIVGGVALFTTLTSYLASKLSGGAARSERKQQYELLKANTERIDRLLQRMETLEEKIARASGIEVPADKSEDLPEAKQE